MNSKGHLTRMLSPDASGAASLPRPGHDQKKAKSAKVSLITYRVVVYIVLGILTFLCLFPFYILLVNSTHSHVEITSRFNWWFGTSFAANWQDLMDDANVPILRSTFNSIWLSLLNATITVYFSALTAYGVHIYDFKGKHFVEVFILAIMMIPSQVSTMSLVIYCIEHGLTNNWLILILPTVASPVVYFYMKQYLESILPYEIVEAARVDGTSEFGIFHKIVLPIIKPALAVQFIFAYVSNWNNYFTPSMLLDKDEYMTIPLILSRLSDNSNPSNFNMGKVYICMTMAVLPVVVVYFIFSKAIIKNLTAGSVKG